MVVEALFDTCILIDYLNGIPAARTELQQFDKRALSVISWMEVMVGTDAHTESAVRSFLRSFRLISIDAPIQEQAVHLRKSKRIKLPDAIIWATAIEQGLLLVTRNTKDFRADEPGIRVPYSL